MGFSRQEYWSGLPFLPPEDLPNPGVKSVSLVPPELAGEFFTTAPSGKPHHLKFSSNHIKKIKIGEINFINTFYLI